MSDFEIPQPLEDSESSEEFASRDQRIEDATHDARALVERTIAIERGESIQQGFAEMMSGAKSAAEQAKAAEKQATLGDVECQAAEIETTLGVGQIDEAAPEMALPPKDQRDASEAVFHVGEDFNRDAAEQGQAQSEPAGLSGMENKGTMSFGSDAPDPQKRFSGVEQERGEVARDKDPNEDALEKQSQQDGELAVQADSAAGAAPSSVESETVARSPTVLDEGDADLSASSTEQQVPEPFESSAPFNAPSTDLKDQSGRTGPSEDLGQGVGAGPSSGSHVGDMDSMGAVPGVDQDPFGESRTDPFGGGETAGPGEIDGFSMDKSGGGIDSGGIGSEASGYPGGGEMTGMAGGLPGGFDPSGGVGVGGTGDPAGSSGPAGGLGGETGGSMPGTTGGETDFSSGMRGTGFDHPEGGSGGSGGLATGTGGAPTGSGVAPGGTAADIHGQVMAEASVNSAFVEATSNAALAQANFAAAMAEAGLNPDGTPIDNSGGMDAATAEALAGARAEAAAATAIAEAEAAQALADANAAAAAAKSGDQDSEGEGNQGEDQTGEDDSSDTKPENESGGEDSGDQDSDGSDDDSDDEEDGNNDANTNGSEGSQDQASTTPRGGGSESIRMVITGPDDVDTDKASGSPISDPVQGQDGSSHSGIDFTKTGAGVTDPVEGQFGKSGGGGFKPGQEVITDPAEE